LMMIKGVIHGNIVDTFEEIRSPTNQFHHRGTEGTEK
jgi:hypothetical protein